MWAIVKGLVVWLLAALPVGVLLGLLVSTFVPENAVVDRSTAAFNGAMAGLQLAVVGGIAAAITTTVSRDMLKRVGGSECITGAAITYGVIILGLCALLLL
ncbi:MAG: hypothetical protein WD533_05005 [Dehalococcoidia bacterium]